MTMTFYDVLQVAHDADDQTVRDAWLRTREGAPAGGLRWLIAWFQGRTLADIDEAYAVLSDPVARALHDRQCAIAHVLAGFRCCA